MKKIIKINHFEKRFAKLIEHPQDKKFFISCYEEKDGFYCLKDTLSKEDIKKLKKLFKVIKANRKGAVKFIPLLITAGIIAGLVFFFTVLANPLLGRALEKGLEAAFEAKANVSGFRLSLIRFEISLKRVTVANRDVPMTNLFEFGRTIIKLKPDAVLRGKVYIEEISAASIRFGTPRTVSGTLPGKPPRPKEEKPQTEGPPLIDLENFDALALFNQEFDKLKTPKLYDEAILIYDESYAKWQGEVANVKNQIADLNEASKPLLDININNLTFSAETINQDVAYIRGVISDINNMINTVQATTETASGIVSGLENDINTARKLEQDARNALQEDIDHLKSYVDLGNGKAFEALEPFIRDVLEDSVEQYLDYGILALNTLEKLQAASNARPKTEKPVKEPKVVFKGRDVIFPVNAYPTFYLGRMSSDFKLQDDPWKWAFDLRDVTSHPNMIPNPVTLKIDVTEENSSLARYVTFNASANLRRDAQQRFGAEARAGGFPFSLENKLDKIGIGGFSGQTHFNVTVNGYHGGSFLAASGIDIRQPELLNPVGTVAEALSYAVTEAGHVNMDIRYMHNAGAKDEFNLTTNITQIMLDALKRTAQIYAQRAMAEIERVVREKIAEYVGDRLNTEQVDQLLRIAKGDKEAIEQLKNTLTEKQNELEQRINASMQRVEQRIDETVDQVRDEAERRAEELRQEAERKAREEAQNQIQNLFSGRRQTQTEPETQTED